MESIASRADAACRYAELGYPVFPILPGNKKPATEHGLKDATIDCSKIAAWWAANPAYNVGLRTDDLLVIDVDGVGNPWLTADREAELSGASQQSTPSGGRHFIFRQPDGTDFRNTAGRLAPKVDTRGNGGYIVVAPSVTAGEYRWTIPLVGRGELPEPPASIVAALRAVPRTVAAPPVAVSGQADTGNLSRTTLLFLQFGAPEGERNARLFSAACDLAGNGFGLGQAEQMLGRPAAGCGMDAAEVGKSIASAYREPRSAARLPELTQERLEQTFGIPMTPRTDDRDAAPPKKAEPPSARSGLSNVETKWITTPEGKKVPELWYRQIDTLSDMLSGLTGGWPRSCAGLLFVENGRGGVRYLGRTPEFFAWMARVIDVHWSSKKEVRSAIGGTATPPTKDEFHAHLKEIAADRYLSVSELPHWPPIDGVYYLPCDLPPATGKHLAEFLDHLNPETENDRQLLLALILSHVWGGPCGARPAFVLSSAHGRGAGKTATANAIADVFGGAFRVQGKENWEQVSKRLLGDRALNLRMLLRDNCKGRMAAEELESFITDPEIQGWRPFHGDFSRPNYVTTCLTANAPRLGADMADRAVEIKIGDRRRGIPFLSWAKRYVAENRLAIIADCIARLKEPPRGEIAKENQDRWGDFQRDILCRCENPNELAELIRERRSETDSDTEEAQEVADAIEKFVGSTPTLPTTEGGRGVRITRDQMREILVGSGTIDKTDSKRFAHAVLCNMLGSHGPLAGLADSKDRNYARCWVWTVGEGELPPI